MALAHIAQALIAIFFIAFVPAWAQDAGGLKPIPPLTRAVIDQTATLSAGDIQTLEAQLRTLQDQRGAQVVILLVASTAPEDIAAYANRVGNTWKIGRREVGDGVLVIVAKDDRRIRIEVAKALEGTIPDIAAARIIDGAMKPRFQQGNYAGGLSAGVAQLAARIAGDAALAGPAQAHPSGADGFDWTDLAIFLFFGVMVAGPVARSLLGGWWGGVVLGAAVAGLACWLTGSVWLGSSAGLIASLYTWMFSGGRRASTLPRRSTRHGAAVGGWSTGGSWGGGGAGSDLGGGGFSSGGGGDFGGGGASGDW